MLILLVKQGCFFYSGFPARNLSEQQQNWAGNCAGWATYWEKWAHGCSCHWRRTRWAASLLSRGLWTCGTLSQETHPPSCMYICVYVYLFGLLPFYKCEKEERERCWNELTWNFCNIPKMLWFHLVTTLTICLSSLYANYVFFREHTHQI